MENTLETETDTGIIHKSMGLPVKTVLHDCETLSTSYLGNSSILIS